MGRQRRRAVGHDNGKRAAVSESCGSIDCSQTPGYVVVGPLNGSQGGPGLLAQCWVCPDHVTEAWALFWDPETVSLTEIPAPGIDSFLAWVFGDAVTVPIVQMVA